ncbi:hypothetical protein FAUST_1882 [Fusarium austroamericanum]|uniref:Uncharacterized protein n=1 Tax=Fusarium austroamericanum TaxID=282268 RepID=A0AAN6HJ64_FUSAU|nr:hypothetical protein FAUST_1882 [Fusarium austroamericanum]
MSAAAAIFDLAVKGLTGVVHIVTLVEKARGYVLEWLKKKEGEQKGGQPDIELSDVGALALSRRIDRLEAALSRRPDRSRVRDLSPTTSTTSSSTAAANFGSSILERVTRRHADE